MVRSKPVLVLLAFTVLAPLVLYTDRLRSYIDTSPSDAEFFVDVSNIVFGNGSGEVKAASQEHNVKSSGVINSDLPREDSSEIQEHKSRVLSAAEDGLTQQVNESSGSDNNVIQQIGHRAGSKDGNAVYTQGETISNPTASEKRLSAGVQHESPKIISRNKPMPDARVRQLRDQLIRAKIYLSLGSIRSNTELVGELRLRIREVQQVVGFASKDSELPRNANSKQRVMERTLSKAMRIQDDCFATIKKLRAFLHSTEEQLIVQKKQALYLTQLTAKTLSKGLHCLPLRLSTEYYSLNHSQREFPNQERLEDPKLYHYALFSDNILATATVLNSTVFHAKEPANHVFHVVTDRLNYAAMRMWFLANPPGNATIQVQSVEEFTWLNSSYSPVLKQLESASMIDFYFRTLRANSDRNLKFRNPKYLSILNHLRFYLPEIFPKLNKVVFLDDDIVVQKDLAGLWMIDLDGKVNGAVETCGENFHRFDKYLNFSNPIISKNFDPHACGWAYGMNVFDLFEWKRQNITEIYHSWQKMNHDRLLWKLGTLPPGLITFWNRTFPLDRSWHVLGLGYNPHINRKEIEQAAVIHYNGNLKPWLEIGIPSYRNYWAKFLNYDQQYLRECNINP